MSFNIHTGHFFKNLKKTSPKILPYSGILAGTSPKLFRNSLRNPLRNSFNNGCCNNTKELFEILLRIVTGILTKNATTDFVEVLQKTNLKIPPGIISRNPLGIILIISLGIQKVPHEFF